VGEDLVDEGEDVRVFDGVDLAAAVPPGGDQPGEAEFREVLADEGDRGSGAGGEGSDVVVVPGEQPHQVQPHGGGQQVEGGCGRLQLRTRRFPGGRRSVPGHDVIILPGGGMLPWLILRRSITYASI
jgi:hypothetical protein